MKYIQKSRWSIWSIIILIFLLNILLIDASNRNPRLFWLFTFTIPLFIIAAYLALKAGKIFQKKTSEKSRSSAPFSDFEWLSNSVYPTRITSTDLKVKIGNDQCSQPYNACILNVGSMETEDGQSMLVGSSEMREYPGNATESPETYYLTPGGVILQIDPSYSGCRSENGEFHGKAFKKHARRPEVKMIELQLSTSNSINIPVDPTFEIGELMDSEMDGSLFSYSVSNACSDAEGMIHFLNNLRELSGGKPVGIRICITNKKDFYQIGYAIQKTQIIPDFIIVEGSVENAGSFNSDRPLYAGMPLYESLLFVSQTLQTHGLKNKIRIIADGRVTSGFDILKILALGANAIFTEMPHYEIVNHPANEAKLSIQFKNRNISEFHYDLMKNTVQIMKVCGFRNMGDITISSFFSSLDVISSSKLSELKGSVPNAKSIKKAYNSIINSLN